MFFEQFSKFYFSIACYKPLENNTCLKWKEQSDVVLLAKYTFLPNKLNINSSLTFWYNSISIYGEMNNQIAYRSCH